VLVLPAVGKSMDVFQAEKGECRSYARQQLGGAPEQAALSRSVTGALAMLTRPLRKKSIDSPRIRAASWGAWKPIEQHRTQENISMAYMTVKAQI
jgi:hypothetical protein